MESAPNRDNRLVLIAILIGAGMLVVCSLAVCGVLFIGLMGPSVGNVYSAPITILTPTPAIHVP
jgi:hypothetical protein